MSGSSKSRLPPCKKVAVIGGGLAGLASIKALKEVGIEPICFEKWSDFGGTWRYREEDIEGLPSIMSTTVINHSKEMGALSNFPFPKECPNYMRHWELLKYVCDVAENFDLLRYITFRTEVIRVAKAQDYEETGRWMVTVKNLDTGHVSTDIYDGVMVGNGHIAHPKWAEFDGMKNFRGKIMHTHSLKRFEEFRGKRVAIVGIGCSALDAAVEVSSVADQVYLSTRTPSYIASRVGYYGMPFDYCMLRRYVALIQDILPHKLSSKILEHYFLDRIFNHKLFGIEPKYPFLSRDPILNDHIGSKILSGSVLIRNNIERFVEDGVYFEKEETKTEVDVVIMATGYQWKFPFLDDGILETDGNKTYLYKCMYPSQLKHHTLAFIGFILPIGPGFPLGELQTRWAAHLFSGKGSLPCPDVMKKDVEERHFRNSKRYSPSDKMTVRVDYIPYADEIASQFGVKPNFWRMLFADPRLFISCAFGPSLSYQYRLYGPHKWSGAREAILTAPERMQFPLSQGLPKNTWFNFAKNFICGHAFIILIVIYFLLLMSVSFHSESSVNTMTLFSFVTIIVLILKNFAEIAINRSFWI